MAGTQEIEMTSTTVGLRGHRVRSPEKARQRMHSVLVAAAEVFVSKGYDATTMDDISERLGGTKGTLYYYFRSKEDIFVEIRRSAISGALERLEAILARGLGPVETLREAIRDLVGHVFGEVDQYAILLEDTHSLSAESRQKIRDLQRRFEAAYIRIIEDGVRQGLFAARDAKLMAFTLLRGAMSVAFWYDPAGPLRPDYITEAVTEQLMSGVEARA